MRSHSLCVLSILAAAGCGAPAAAPSRTGQIIGNDDLEVVEAAKGTPLYDASRAIAHARLGNAGCTAFRVGADLFMTNNHCWEGNSCASTSFTLGYERDTPAAEQKTVRCKEVLLHDSGLDFALYRVETTAVEGGSIEGFPTVTLSRRALTVGQSLFVTGFPAGYDWKMIDRGADCKVSELAGGSWPNYLSHTCDTVSGSSGSPVMDRDSGEVVGLHWGYMEAGSNKATAMPKILDAIKRGAPAAYGQLTVKE